LNGSGFYSVTGDIGSVAAAEPSINPTTADQLKQLNDQTIIPHHRVSLDSEWDHFKDGAEKDHWTLAGLWGWPGDSQDWGARFTLPTLGYYRLIKHR
jgi:hypothetical protein